MNGKCFSVGFSLFFALSSASLAATPIGQGVIQFHGSIVEPSCTSRMGTNSTIQLYKCPTPVLISAISVREVELARSVSAVNNSSVNVKLLAASSREGRYYSQQYELVDDMGKPVRTGAYLITLTWP